MAETLVGFENINGKPVNDGVLVMMVEFQKSGG